jgi:Peptidase S24-like
MQREVDVAGQLLRQGGCLKIKARGGSMIPFVLDGDVAVVRPSVADAIRVGDVICYQTAPGRLFLHRVIGRDGDAFIAKGDALPFTEIVRSAHLLGRVVALERRGRLLPLDTWTARWRSRAIAACSPFLPRLLPLALGLRRAWRGAFVG